VSHVSRPEEPCPVVGHIAWVRGPLGDHPQRIVSDLGVVPIVVAVDGFGYYAVGPKDLDDEEVGLVALHTETEWHDPEPRPVRLLEDGTIVVSILGSDLELYIGRPV
jgi:hypothetical protein